MALHYNSEIGPKLPGVIPKYTVLLYYVIYIISNLLKSYRHLQPKVYIS